MVSPPAGAVWKFIEQGDLPGKETKMDEQTLARIGRMEKALNRSAAAVDALGRTLDEMEALREDAAALFRYYGSEDWFSDRELTLPPGTKAGVLGEDAVYDTMQELRDEAFRMLSLAAEILRDWI